MFKSITTLALLTSFCFADTYTGLDVKNGKGIKGSELRTENLVGNIKIDNLDVSEIIVKVDGSEDYLRNLIIDQDGSVLVIKHKDPLSPSLKNRDNTVIHIQLPRQSNLHLGLSHATATVADRGGDVTLQINGNGTAAIDGIEGTLKSTISGNGDIKIVKLNGNLETNIQGNGELHIENGKSDLVKASISGSGDIMIGGEVKDADLTIEGAGNITINRLTGNATQNVMGQGTIDIKSKV